MVIIIGTAKQHVTDDYALRLSNGNAACGNLMMESLSKIGNCELTNMCPLLNISQCQFTENNKQFRLYKNLNKTTLFVNLCQNCIIVYISFMNNQ